MSPTRAERRTGRRLVLVSAVAAIAAAVMLLMTTTQGASAHRQRRSDRSSHARRPVIVLEHGAWADSESWNAVIAQLERDGYTVYAPPNLLRGLSSDSASLHAFLIGDPVLQGHRVVLVGHSYGGAVITNAAVGAPGVRALVYVDAFIPDQGQTLAQLDKGSCLGGSPAKLFDLVPYPRSPAGDVDTYIKASVVPSCFATGLPAAQAAVIAATQRPLAASTLSEPSGPPAWKNLPSWAVVGTGDKVIPPAEQLTMAHRAGAHIIKVAAGHLSLISRPRTVVGVIEDAARATQ